MKNIILIFLLVTISTNCQSSYKITSNQIERSYALYKTFNYAQYNQHDLLIVLHGAMGTGNKLSKKSKYKNIADKNNLIVAFPNGKYKSWADARNVSKASKNSIDDVLFITNIITELKQKHQINKIYIVGISNGGFMVQTLACKLSTKIDAFASIISSLPKKLESNCKNHQNTPMLLMNGTKDRYVPYKGGSMPKFTKGGEILSTANTINYWKNVNQTSKLPKIKKLSNTNNADNSKVVKHTYFKNNKPQVVLYKIIGGGHGVPGNYTKRNPRFFKLGYVNQDINAEEEIFKFFKNH